MHQLSGVKLRKLQQAQRLPRSSQSASHGTLGSAKPSRRQLLGVTVKLIITLYPGSLSRRPTESESQQKEGGLQGNNIRPEGCMYSTGMSG